MLDRDLQEIRSELWPLIDTGNCFAWVGSGLSKNIGYPEWPKAIEEICNACGIPYLGTSEDKTADNLINKAEECKSANGALYNQTLARLYGTSMPTTRTAFALLMRLPFRGYITTNFDPLLNEAAAFAGNRVLQAYPVLYSGNIDSTISVFYIHGIATAAGNNLVLARSDFDNAYATAGLVHALLLTVLTYKSIIFIGCSLQEPVMYEVFKRVHNIQEQIKEVHPRVVFPQRRALLPYRYVSRKNPLNPAEIIRERDSDRERTEHERFSEMDVKIVRYDPLNPALHMEIEEILEQLCNAAGVAVRLKPTITLGEALPS